MKMISRVMELYEVLEEEYAATGGSITPPSAEIAPDDILDEGRARTTLVEYLPDGQSGKLRDRLEELRTDVSGKLARVFAAFSFSPVTRLLIKNYRRLDCAVQEAVNRRMLDEVFARSLRPFTDRRLQALYEQLHNLPVSKARSALCLSGGGVRSVAFAVGVLQGLARCRVLKRFDFLSTVGGGSHAGAWLSSWASREPGGIDIVETELARPTTTEAATIIDRSEPAPIAALRRTINFLRPKPALFSADSWNALGIYLRNIVLKFFVVLPILIGVAALPRIAAFLFLFRAPYPIHVFLHVAAILLGLAMMWTALSQSRDAGAGHRGLTVTKGDRGVVLFFMYPVLGACVAAAIAGMRLRLLGLNVPPGSLYVPAAIALTIGIIATSLRRMRMLDSSLTPTSFSQAQKILVDFVALAVATGVTALLVLGALNILQNVRPWEVPWTEMTFTGLATSRSHWYVCSVVPILLLIAFVHINIVIGISGRVTADAEREWWARAASWLLVASATWFALSVIVIFGPVILHFQTLPTGSIGLVATTVATVLGIRGAHEEAKDDGPPTRIDRLVRAVMAFSTPAFVVFILIVVSVVTSAALKSSNRGEIEEIRARTESWRKAALEESPTSRPKPPVPPSNPAVLSAEHLTIVARTTPADVMKFVMLAFAGFLLSHFISVNDFSAAGLHRSRVTRSFLAAARPMRRPDELSGFDPNDDISLWSLRLEYLRPESFSDPAEFITALKERRQELDPVLKILNRSTLRSIKHSGSTTIYLVCRDINRKLSEPWLARTGDLVAANRQMLDPFINRWLRVRPSRPPLPVMTASMTLFSKDQPYSDDPLPAPFTMSPLHCGSHRTGYRTSREFGGRNGLSIAAAASISSAVGRAGEEFSSQALSFFRMLLNIFEPERGWWLGNPGWSGDRTHSRSNPTNLLLPILSEALHETDETSLWVPLSSGGRFDNLGLYQMVLRRCRYIVVCDATRDPNYRYRDLAAAIWKIRVDLGIPITLPKLNALPRPVDAQREAAVAKYCAVATIGYSAVDGRSAQDGVLVYLKPVLHDDAKIPTDVYSYGASGKGFPHENIAPGTISQQQFESYRALGRHIVEVITNNKTFDSIHDLASTAVLYTRDQVSGG